MSNDHVIWNPSSAFIEKTRIHHFMKQEGLVDYDALIKASRDPEWFWPRALKHLGMLWDAPYHTLLDCSDGFPFAKWFLGGKLNIVRNCLDRHVEAGLAEKTAFVWESELGPTRDISYGEWQTEVARVANFLKSVGVKKGDRIGLYMPMIPEMVFALFAAFKIGAVIVPVFSGFGAQALSVRLVDAECKILFTADVSTRRGKEVDLAPLVKEALSLAPCVETVVVKKNGRGSINPPVSPFVKGGKDSLFSKQEKTREVFSSVEKVRNVSPLEKNDFVPPLKKGDTGGFIVHDWDDVIPKQSKTCATESLDAEHPCLIIYTSGTTGKPKGTVHTHAGCLAQMSKELGYHFDLKPDDRFFWVTDIGWMMGPWEIIGVSFFGATFAIFEGAPDYPNPDRVWQMVEKHRYTHLGLSPTLVRVLKKSGDHWVTPYAMNDLRILGSTGEAWDPESYQWFFEKVGKSRAPIMNISGGTEIVGCLLAPLPIRGLKPCSLQGPALGMDVDVLNEAGESVRGEVGYLVCKQPAPSMTKAFLNDRERYLDTYFSKWPTIWNHGDWAIVDPDGFWFLQGRSDDTIKVAGKRTGPAEIESALLEHASVAEAAVIGVPHAVKGETVVCFVVLKPSAIAASPTEETQLELINALSDQVVLSMGKTLRPEAVYIVPALPKTRSGKIVRGTIKKAYLGKDLGDVSSIENPDVLGSIPKKEGL